MLELENVAVGYAGRAHKTVLQDLTLTANAGELICVLGRNGAGKSTLMRTIAGLQPALAGRVTVDGSDVGSMRATARARKIAVVLTERVSSPGLRVDDVLALGRQPFTTWQGRLSDEDVASITHALEITESSQFIGRYFDDLSDGEKQRVMIARAIAQSSRLIVLDEITAFLDLPGKVRVMSLLRRIARENSACVLLSSHDLELALELADRAWLIPGSGGVIDAKPEGLIESGAIQSAFDTDELVFSEKRRRFVLAAS